jgi:hypothetical protein
MKYAIDILKEHLKNERQARGQAKEWLRGSGIDGRNKDDVRAFEESLSLAQKRIPQLEEAIETLGLKESSK